MKSIELRYILVNKPINFQTAFFRDDEDEILLLNVRRNKVILLTENDKAKR